MNYGKHTRALDLSARSAKEVERRARGNVARLKGNEVAAYVLRKDDRMNGPPGPRGPHK